MLILVDQDGVLADFEAGFLQLWRAEHPDAPYVDLAGRTTWLIKEQYPVAWHAAMDAIHTRAGFFAGLPVMDGAVQAMDALLQAGHDVRICTSPLTRWHNCVAEKHAWVEEHLGPQWVRRIILTKDKTLCAGDVLIDDKPHVTGALVPSWTHLRFDTPFNSAGDHPLLNWQNFEQVLARVERDRRSSGRLLTLAG